MQDKHRETMKIKIVYCDGTKKGAIKVTPDTLAFFLENRCSAFSAILFFILLIMI